MADDRERRKHPRVEHVPGQLEMFPAPACSPTPGPCLTTIEQFRYSLGMTEQLAGEA